MFFFSSRRRHTRYWRDWSSDVCSSDLPYLHFEAAMPEPTIGADFAASLVEEFWRALVVNAALTVHVDLLRARNAHHAAEAIFKAGALALHAATRLTGDVARIPSTKGVLA